MPSRLARSSSAESRFRSSDLPPGSPDEAGPTAGQGDGSVAGQLEAAQVADLEQMAHVQAVGRRVEPAVGGEPVGVEPLLEPGVGHLVDQPPEAEILGEVGHGLSLPRRRTGVACSVTGRPRWPEGRRRRSPSTLRSASASREPRPDTVTTPGRGAPVAQPLPPRQLRPGARGAQRRPRAAGHRRRSHPTSTAGCCATGPTRPWSRPTRADYHWFAGDGMIHAHLPGRRQGRRATATAGCGPGPWPPSWAPPAPAGPTEPVDGPANTHVIRHAGTTLALVESGFPHAAVRRPRAGPASTTSTAALASPMTAHPKVDPVTGELVFFGCDVFGPPFLRYHVVDAAGPWSRTEDIDIPRATMMHDFGVTATRVVFLDLPVLFDLDLAAMGRSAPLPVDPRGRRPGRDHAPERGQRRRPVDRHRPGLRLPRPQRLSTTATVVMDVIRYDRAFDTEPGGPSPRIFPSWPVGPSTRRPSASPSAASTTPRSSSRGSTTRWPDCPTATATASASGTRPTIPPSWA